MAFGCGPCVRLYQCEMGQEPGDGWPGRESPLREHHGIQVFEWLPEDRRVWFILPSEWEGKLRPSDGRCRCAELA